MLGLNEIGFCSGQQLSTLLIMAFAMQYDMSLTKPRNTSESKNSTSASDVLRLEIFTNGHGICCFTIRGIRLVQPDPVSCLIVSWKACRPKHGSHLKIPQLPGALTLTHICTAPSPNSPRQLHGTSQRTPPLRATADRRLTRPPPTAHRRYRRRSVTAPPWERVARRVAAGPLPRQQ